MNNTIGLAKKVGVIRSLAIVVVALVFLNIFQAVRFSDRWTRQDHEAWASAHNRDIAEVVEYAKAKADLKYDFISAKIDAMSEDLAAIKATQEIILRKVEANGHKK
jgi:hypothetical protein